jgi:protein-S-isoprenylcysteine O-methyltransferase Ste14
MAVAGLQGRSALTTLSLPHIGGWLFRRRSRLPIPIVVALWLLPASSHRNELWWAGAAAVVSGELLRLWAVHHIGAISRTRAERLGPLVASGPFAWVRNPLYLANLGLWGGFALCTGQPYMAAASVVLLGLQYQAIVRWEEELLESRLGQIYREYATRVPRWIPRRPDDAGRWPAAGWRCWRRTLLAERTTLGAIALGCLLVWLKGSV